MLPESECHLRNCMYFNGVKWLGKGEDSEAYICKAFPKGIPAEIAYGKNKHTEPFKGDNGIQFEKEEQ